MTQAAASIAKLAAGAARWLGAAWLVAGLAFAQGEAVPVGREVLVARLTRVAADNARRQATLRAIFQEAGCGESLAELPVKRARVPNLVCTLPATGGSSGNHNSGSGSVIIVGAHFDYTGLGQGAADNWSGAALLPSLFESLRGHARRHTFLFIGFTDEEKGMRGSQEYVRRLTPAQKAGIRAMVNLDTLGLSTSKVWLNRSDPTLTEALYLKARSMNLPLDSFNFERLGSSDSESFRKAKIPSICIHSITSETNGILHSSRDNLGVVRLNEYYETYRLVVAYLALLDTALE